MDGGGDTPAKTRARTGSREDPATQALSRVGVVDVGSNSVRLVVFDGAARSPAYFYNEKIMCGLGRGLAETGQLNPEGRARALSALIRFQHLAEGMGIDRLSIVATAAVREAEDGPAFRDDVMQATGLDVQVIDGREEARLSAQGVLLGWPGSYGLVCDIGGSSMELAELSDGKVGKRITSQLGPFSLRGVKGGRKGRQAEIQTVVAELMETLGPQSDRLFLVGGSWRAIARIDMIRRDYPLSVLHEYRMTRSDVSRTIKFIQKQDLEQLRQAAGLSEARMALVPIASEVLGVITKTFRPHDIAVSSYGLREGLLYERMSDDLRARDPLIEACRFSEQKDARNPGFGTQLFDFVSPLFPKASDESRRIHHAACLLHDVSWRAHPDYRHEVCFDNATRANLGGLTHKERVFLGIALLHRYKNSHSDSRFEDLFGLLDDDRLREAETLGKAMRFGSMFSVAASDRMGMLKWRPRKKLLSFHLAPGTAPLFGEVAEARFASLANAIGATTEVVQG